MRIRFGKTPVETVRDYIAALNDRDLAALDPLLADDLVLTDSSGREVAGKTACLEMIGRAWTVWPDYVLYVDDMVPRGEEVLLRGRVSCSDPLAASPTHFRTRADGRHIYSWESFGTQPGSVIDYLESAMPAAKPEPQPRATA